MKKIMLALGIIFLFLCVTFTQINASQVSDDHDSVIFNKIDSQSLESNYQSRIFKKARVSGTISGLGQGLRGIVSWPGVLPLFVHGRNPNLYVEILEPYQETIVFNYINYGRFFALYADWDIEPYLVDLKEEIWHIEGILYLGRVVCY